MSHPDPARARARRVAFGARVRELRRARHLDRRQVAARAGLRLVGYLRLEWGRYFPDLDTAYAVADALGVGIVDLFPGAPGGAAAHSPGTPPAGL